MKNKLWDHPICVGDDLIFSPYQAYTYLRTKWPDHNQPILASAHTAILAALDGRIPLDEARERFEAAMKSARLN